MRKIYGAMLAALAFAGCEKNDQAGGASLAVDAALKSRFGYRPGSYWIYRDILTGSIDSFAAVSIDSGATLGGIDSLYISCNCMLDHTALLIEQYKGTGADAVYTANWKWSLSEHDVVISMPDMNAQLFKYPFTVGQVTNFNNDVGILTSISDQVINTTDTFRNVAEVNHNDTTNKTLPQYNHWYYISEDAGIVKMRLNYPGTSRKYVWELLRYNIVR